LFARIAWVDGVKVQNLLPYHKIILQEV